MTSARVQLQRLSCQGHKRISEHNGHSSRAHIAHVHVHSGSPVLQEECRVGQEWEELRKGRPYLCVEKDLILGKNNLNIFQPAR